MLKDFTQPLLSESMPPRKRLVKKGTLDIDMVETTPVVWDGRLMRFEWVRPDHYKGREPDNYFRFTDMETEEHTAPFAHGYAFGSAYVDDETHTAYAFAPTTGGGCEMDVFWSHDLVSWESKRVFTFPKEWQIFNTSVCKGPQGYVMAIEMGGERELVGVGFTMIFAVSEDLVNWTLMETGKHAYTRLRYSACPVLRYSGDGFFYMIYLEGLPCHRWLPYIVRTKDFEIWELGMTNPIMCFDDDDKIVADPGKYTPEELEYIRTCPDVNNSDIDLCEFGGKTVILYSWGIQLGKENLAWAEYDGPMDEFFASFFPV